MPFAFTIHRDELPSSGRVLAFTRPATWAQAILSDGVFEPIDEVRFTGKASRIGRDVLLQLETAVSLRFRCSRCGDPSEILYTTRLSHLFAAAGGSSLQIPPEVDLDAEFDVTENAGTRIDAEPAVVAAFAADLPGYPLCDPDCAGAPAVHETEPAPGAKVIDPRLAPLIELRAALADEPASGPDHDLA